MQLTSSSGSSRSSSTHASSRSSRLRPTWPLAPPCRALVWPPSPPRSCHLHGHPTATPTPPRASRSQASSALRHNDVAGHWCAHGGGDKEGSWPSAGRIYRPQAVFFPYPSRHHRSSPSRVIAGSSSPELVGKHSRNLPPRPVPSASHGSVVADHHPQHQPDPFITDKGGPELLRLWILAGSASTTSAPSIHAPLSSVCSSCCSKLFSLP